MNNVVEVAGQFVSKHTLPLPAAREVIEVGASKKDTEILARAVIAKALSEHETEGVVAMQAYAGAADAVMAALKHMHISLVYTSTNSRIDYINL